MVKLLLILTIGGALASGFAAHSQPPLLIDAPQPTLDGGK